MAAPQTLIIWEKTAYCRADDEKGWLRVPLVRPDDVIAVVQEHFKKNSKIALVYDPDTLQTEFSECPPGGRAIAREALAATHESIANMHTAWGIQESWPMPGSGGNHGTFCSYETAPILYPLLSPLRDLGYEVDNAFPLVTLGMQMGEAHGRTRIFMVIDQGSQAFVYLHTSTGVRAVRKLYAGKRPGEYDVWSEISMVFGEYGVSFDDGSQRPLMRVCQAPGTDMKTQCPYWDVLKEQAQVELVGFESLGIMLGSLQGRQPSSLMADMPKFINLDFAFKVMSGVLAAILLGFGIFTYIDLSKSRKDIRGLQTQDAGYAAQEARLRANKAEIESLNKLYSQDIFEKSRGRFKMLDVLPSAIPRDATLTQLFMGAFSGQGGAQPTGQEFRIAGVFWNWKASMQSGRNAPGGSASSATPFTQIKSSLETSVQGLLIPPANNQIQPNGDFLIQGTTPQENTSR